ncbi:hypothetical protein GUJ93_ZPchr0009g1940 [Zizania palustris]|uniref:Uncharacterized protein n=1 Tax=Zizania palustris TaxID=103762 RepID=A0A8J5VLH3_ZIZPA|nr:hypothetical protein GUJ93_ZPchr0009g1940 [Zizania palustris]
MSAMEAANGEDIPVVDLDGLPSADDFLFGFPARFDSTEPLYHRYILTGKPTGFFINMATTATVFMPLQHLLSLP